jgi:hypothetical protein
MKYLIDIINTDNEPNTINKIMEQLENKKFDLYYNNQKLNKSSLTSEQADYEISLIIINYGYKPEKIKVK